MVRSQRTVTNTTMTPAITDLRVLFQRQISRTKENWGTEPKMRQCGSSAEGGRDSVGAGVTGACALFRGGDGGRGAGWDGVFILVLQEGCLWDIWVRRPRNWSVTVMRD